MRLTTAHRAAPLALAIACAFTLAACGGGDPEPDTCPSATALGPDRAAIPTPPAPGPCRQ